PRHRHRRRHLGPQDRQGDAGAGGDLRRGGVGESAGGADGFHLRRAGEPGLEVYRRCAGDGLVQHASNVRVVRAGSRRPPHPPECRAARLIAPLAPLPPAPSPKRRGGAEGLPPPLRLGEGAGGRGSRRTRRRGDMIFAALSTFALRQVVGDGAENVTKALGDHFSDQGRLLLDALHKSNERAWKAFEVALAGESFWNKLDAAEDKALRQQIRSLLDVMPLPLLTGRGEFRRLCLKELQEACKKGLLLSGTAEEVARSASTVGGGDQLAVLERER